MLSCDQDKADEFMIDDETKVEQVEQLLATLDTPETLEDERFKLFLDQMPIAIAIAEMEPAERIIYTNLSFEQLSQKSAADIIGRSWNSFDWTANEPLLSVAVIQGQDNLGIFSIASSKTPVNVWSNIIEDEDGVPKFRLVALAAVDRPDKSGSADLVKQLQHKDTLLREIQHRVKNNLQMITALIRMEARRLPEEGVTFDRLAGRVEALALLYQSLSEQGVADEIDLGVYLSQVASALMRAQAVEGIRLDLKVDTWPVSINVAMPTGLVVNELLMNALKHGFKGREGGTITLHSLVDATGCRVVIADDGLGLSEGEEWPKRGKLSYLILQSLRENAKAKVEVQSRPGGGMRVTISFARHAAAADIQANDPTGA
ncbi:sensor histidine kinase [Labrys miyagiensis]|nr:histidine kinase dimerization/phosphoacceptor domain -containing protein [Labrys miyagiensis]